MVAGREGDDAAGALVRAELEQAIGGAAQLEAASGLQAFGLGPEADAVDLERQQRRAQDVAADPCRRGEDAIAGGAALGQAALIPCSFRSLASFLSTMSRFRRER